jgi:hypothetical protein
MVRFPRLRGGDVNGDFVGVPSSQLAVFPGTTHFFGLAKTELVLGAVLPFLDAPLPRRSTMMGALPQPARTGRVLAAADPVGPPASYRPASAATRRRGLFKR